jgi:hypothetical protein
VVALLFGGGGSGGTAWAAGAAPALAVPEGAQSGLNLRSTTSGAEVSIDGDSVGQTPVSKVLGLAAGEHTIRVARPGFAPYIDVFRTKPGQVAKIDVELVPVAGVISLTSPTGAVRVFVDDKYIGDAPVESELTPGSHQVRVERGGFYPESFAVSAVAGQVIEKAVTLKDLPPELNPYLRKAPPPPKWYQKWWVWTIGAAGVVVVATAIIVPVVLLTRKDACDNVDMCVIGLGSTPAALTTSPQPLHLGIRF